MNPECDKLVERQPGEADALHLVHKFRRHTVDLDIHQFIDCRMSQARCFDLAHEFRSHPVDLQLDELIHGQVFVAGRLHGADEIFGFRIGGLSGRRARRGCLGIR